MKRRRFNEGGNFWPTPEKERTPIYTIELSRVDGEESYVETPMKYSKIYYSDDEAFADAEKLADEYANEEGEFEVYVMGGEYQIGDGEDIYGDPYVMDSIQTGKRGLFRESMDVDVDLRDIIKRDPTEFALAMRSFMAGLVEMGNEKGLIDAIQGISNNEIAMAMFKIENEEWDRFANED